MEPLRLTPVEEAPLRLTPVEAAPLRLTPVETPKSTLADFLRQPDAAASVTTPVTSTFAPQATNDQITSSLPSPAPLTLGELEATLMEPAFQIPESVKEVAAGTLFASSPALLLAGKKGADVARGVTDVAAGGVETLASPGGAAILAAQTVPGLNVAIDTALAGSMVQSGSAKLGEASVTGDVREATAGIAELALAGLAAAGGTARALGERRGALRAKETPPIIPVERAPQASAAVAESKAILSEATPKADLPVEPVAEGGAAPATPKIEETPAGKVEPAGEVPEAKPVAPEVPASELVPQFIGIKNARVDAQRAGRGEPPLLSRLKDSNPAQWERAMKLVEEDPGITDRLISEFEQAPRAPSPEESLIVERRLVELQNDFDQAIWEGIKAKDAGDAAGVAAARIKERAVRESLEPVERVARDIGTRSGQSLQSRQILLRENFSYAGIERKMRAAQDYAPLSDRQVVEAKATAEKWKAAHDALQEKLAEQTTELAREQEARQLAELKAQEAAAQAKVTGRVRTIVLKVEKAIENEANAARERLKGRILSIGPDDIRDIGWIAADNLVKLGENLPVWTAKMIETFGEQIRPHLGKLWEEAKRLHAEMARKASDSAEQAAIVGRVSRKAPLSESVRLEQYKKRLGKRIEDLERRVRERDYSKKPRSTPPVNEEILALRSKLEKVKSDFEEGLLAKERAARSPYVKVLDALASWKRAAVLTSLGIFEKLTAAGLWRQALMPVEDIAGSIIGAAPGISRIAKRAPIEGGFSLNAEIKGIAEGWTTGLKEAYQKATRGETALDVLHGHRRPGFGGEPTAWGSVLEPKFLHYAAFLHAALKAPTFRDAYTRALIKLTEHDARNGVNVMDPLGQLNRSNLAYEYASRQIFLQDNGLVTAYRRFLGRLDAPDKVTGKPNPALKALSTAIKMELPIVKVPTNIVGEAVEYLTGSLTGSVRAAKALRNGVEKLPPAEADMIMRQLKKGALGLPAATLIGYLLRDQIGGFFLPGVTHVRGDDGKPHPGEMSIGGITIGEQDLHSSFMLAVMFGATVGKAADAKIRKKDYEPQGVWNGLMAASLGLADQTPFYREIADLASLREPKERERILGSRIASTIIPGGVSWIARHTDTQDGSSIIFGNRDLVKRQPRDLGEYLKASIPGMREEVPVKKERR